MGRICLTDHQLKLLFVIHKDDTDPALFFEAMQAWNRIAEERRSLHANEQEKDQQYHEFRKQLTVLRHGLAEKCPHHRYPDLADRYDADYLGQSDSVTECSLCGDQWLSDQEAPNP